MTLEGDGTIFLILPLSTNLTNHHPPDYSSILLFAGTSHSRLLPHKLLPSPNGGYTVSATPPITLPSPSISALNSISAFNPQTGAATPATPAALSALRSGQRFPGCLCLTSQTTAYILRPSSSSASHPPKPSHRDFDSIFCSSASLVNLDDGGPLCLAAIFGDGSIRAFTIPALKPLARQPISHTLEPARLPEAIITPSGSVLGWTGPSELAVLSVWGTGQSLPKSQDRLFNPTALIPPRPTISNLQWIAGTQYLTPDDLDLLSTSFLLFFLHSFATDPPGALRGPLRGASFLPLVFPHSFTSDPPGALRGPLRGAPFLLPLLFPTPSRMSLWGPSGGHCVELHSFLSLASH